MTIPMLHKQIKKGEILQLSGDTTNRIYLVAKGLLRMYLIDKKGKEHIFLFAPEGWILSDFYAQVNHSPSAFFIDSLEDSEVEIFPKDFVVNLATTADKWDFTNQEKLIKRLAVMQQRLVMLLTASAWERYQHFLEMYPNLTYRVPQKMIASYLGITPEALSKLRGRESKK